ncbi:MAG: hypothetical protein WDW38_000270 [Sanguina aurantia]
MLRALPLDGEVSVDCEFMESRAIGGAGDHGGSAWSLRSELLRRGMVTRCGEPMSEDPHPLVLLVRLSAMEFRVPRSLVNVLQEWGYTFVTVNWVSMDEPGLRRTLDLESRR